MVRRESPSNKIEEQLWTDLFFLFRVSYRCKVDERDITDED